VLSPPAPCCTLRASAYPITCFLPSIPTAKLSLISRGAHFCWPGRRTSHACYPDLHFATVRATPWETLLSRTPACCAEWMILSAPADDAAGGVPFSLFSRHAGDSYLSCVADVTQRSNAWLMHAASHAVTGLCVRKQAMTSPFPNGGHIVVARFGCYLRERFACCFVRGGRRFLASCICVFFPGHRWRGTIAGALCGGSVFSGGTVTWRGGSVSAVPPGAGVAYSPLWRATCSRCVRRAFFPFNVFRQATFGRVARLCNMPAFCVTLRQPLQPPLLTTDG